MWKVNGALSHSSGFLQCSTFVTSDQYLDLRYSVISAISCYLDDTLNGSMDKVYVFDSSMKYYQHWVSIITVLHVAAAAIVCVCDRNSVKLISHRISCSSSLVVPLQSFPNPLTPPAVVVETVIAVVLS